MLMGVCCTFALFIRQIRKEGCRAFELSAVGEQTIKGSVNSQQRKTCELLVGNAIKWRMRRLAVNSSLGEGYGVGSAGCYKRCCWCNYQHYCKAHQIEAKILCSIYNSRSCVVFCLAAAAAPAKAPLPS